MIELFMGAVTVPQPIRRRQQMPNVVMVGKQTPATTIKSFGDFCEQLEAKKSSAVSQTGSFNLENDEIFTSPIKKTVMVTAEFVVGGRLIPLPIDDEDIVDFDE